MKDKFQISNLKSQILILLILGAVLVSCRPKGILHSWEMKNVLIDLHKTEATIQVAGILYGHEEEKGIYYAEVLEKHGITQAQFDSSLVWYTAHPQLFDKIYPRVLKQLKAEEEQFLALHADEFENGTRPGKPGLFVTDGPKGSSKKQKPTFTREQVDSILTVTISGFPHSWNVRDSVQDLEDQLFPQIGVLGGGVVDTLGTRVDLP